MKKVIITAMLTSTAWISFFGYVAHERAKNRKAKHDRYKQTY